MRKIGFVTGEYYHIYNRGANKANIFLDEKDHWKFFDGLRDFNNKTYYEQRLEAIGLSVYSRNGKEPSSFPFRELGSFLSQQERVVDIISYSMNPNHFHLLVKQLCHKGISNIMHKLGLSYTNYFNSKYEHSGHVLQGPFKAAAITNEEYLLWLLGYVNGNVEIHNLDKASEYPWSSYRAICDYINGKQISNLSVLAGLEAIKERFSNASDFYGHMEKVIKEAKEQKDIEKKMKKYLLEKF